MTDLDPARLAAMQALLEVLKADYRHDGGARLLQISSITLAKVISNIQYLLAAHARLQGENDGLRDANERLKANYISEGQFLAAARADVARLQAERDEAIANAEYLDVQRERLRERAEAAEAARDEAQRALEECRRAGRPQYGTPEASTGAPKP